MKQEERNILIKLDTTIDDNGEMENSTNNHIGKFFNKDTLDVLVYTEQLEDDEKVSNLISIHPDKVNIKRTGAVTMNQQFLVGKTTENIYRHPHGNIHMATHTNWITYESIKSADQGKLTISYTVKLNVMEEERKHLLVLTYKEDIE